ncbi:MAG: hypothetical protein JWO66_2871 [Candidatus Eremiobacteraeota bacterium]|jgi:hypothetical protein|nr:hypothetical protein [Candidatus Eremiobacteraeota bacterium]
MRLPAFAALLAVSLLALPAPGLADEGDILVQAGHEGRPESCAPHHVKACNLGTGGGGLRERDWTATVADRATRVLREHGYTVIRRPADYEPHDTVRAAVFLHFDGATPCASGASVGFPDTTSRAFVDSWEKSYRAWFPYRFVGENFTKNESQYYGFRKVDAPEKMLIEFGEMTCPPQLAWMTPRLTEMGDRLAAFLMERVPR